ncbi:MAG: hypothetical protein NZ839_00420, partial [Endomicrobia bacterium]|nr:hypothetical protein [Endomicrobiia bacterium]
MKKVLWIIFSVLIIIFCLQIGVNCFLLFNKNFLAKKLLKGNYKISGLFYIFPNLIFIHRVNFSSGLYNLNVDNVFLSFNILKMLKRNFVVNSLKTKNVFLEMAQVENLVSGENLLLQDKIQQFFVNLPPKMEFKKINVKYKNEDINIYNLSKRIHRDKIEINIDGAWKKYKFQFSLLTDPTKFEWLLKGKIFLLLPGERADLKLSELFFIETILSGT